MRRLLLQQSSFQILDKSFLMEKSDKSKNDYNAGSQERLIILCEIHCYLLIHFIEAAILISMLDYLLAIQPGFKRKCQLTLR